MSRNFLDDEIVALINWMSLHRKMSSKKFLLIPRVAEMLARLKGNYLMAVVTARDEKGTLHFLEQFDLAKYFDVVVTGQSAEHTKPYPDPILFAAKLMNVKPEECLVFEDGQLGIQAAEAAGMMTVFIPADGGA